MLVSKEKKQQQDSVVTNALVILKAINNQPNCNCGRKCCISKIIKQIGLEAANPKATVCTAPPLRRDNHLNDIDYSRVNSNSHGT
jgi:hypothetical protein